MADTPLSLNQDRLAEYLSSLPQEDQKPSLLKRFVTPIADQIPGARGVLESFANPTVSDASQGKTGLQKGVEKGLEYLHRAWHYNPTEALGGDKVSSRSLSDLITGESPKTPQDQAKEWARSAEEFAPDTLAKAKGFVSGSTGAVTPAHIAAAATLSPELAGASTLTKGLATVGNAALTTQAAGDVLDSSKTPLERGVAGANALVGALGMGVAGRQAWKGLRTGAKAVEAAPAVAAAQPHPLSNPKTLLDKLKSGVPFTPEEKDALTAIQMDERMGARPGTVGPVTKTLTDWEQATNRTGRITDRIVKPLREADKAQTQAAKMTQGEAASDIAIQESAQKDLDQKLNAASKTSLETEKAQVNIQKAYEKAIAAQEKLRKQKAAEAELEQIKASQGMEYNEPTSVRRTIKAGDESATGVYRAPQEEEGGGGMGGGVPVGGRPKTTRQTPAEGQSKAADLGLTPQMLGVKETPPPVQAADAPGPVEPTPAATVVNDRGQAQTQEEYVAEKFGNFQRAAERTPAFKEQFPGQVDQLLGTKFGGEIKGPQPGDEPLKLQRSAEMKAAAAGDVPKEPIPVPTEPPPPTMPKLGGKKGQTPKAQRTSGHKPFDSLDPVVQKEIGNIRQELSSLPATPGFLQEVPEGGSMTRVGGGAGSNVWQDLGQQSGKKLTRSQMDQKIYGWQSGVKVDPEFTKAVEDIASARVGARGRTPEGVKVSKPELAPPAGSEMTPGELVKAAQANEPVRTSSSFFDKLGVKEPTKQMDMSDQEASKMFGIDIPEANAISPETRQQLRSLGYTEPVINKMSPQQATNLSGGRMQAPKGGEGAIEEAAKQVRPGRAAAPIDSQFRLDTPEELAAKQTRVGSSGIEPGKFTSGPEITSEEELMKLAGEEASPQQAMQELHAKTSQTPPPVAEVPFSLEQQVSKAAEPKAQDLLSQEAPAAWEQAYNDWQGAKQARKAGQVSRSDVSDAYANFQQHAAQLEDSISAKAGADQQFSPEEANYLAHLAKNRHGFDLDEAIAAIKARAGGFMKDPTGAAGLGTAARMGFGGLTGYMFDPVGKMTGNEDDTTAALSGVLGAGLGAAAPSLIRALPTIAPEALWAQRHKPGEWLNAVSRAGNSMLLSPMSVAKKGMADLGALPSYMMDNPEKAGEAIKSLSQNFNMGDILRAGKQGFMQPVEAASGLENVVNNPANPLSWSPRAMGGLTSATKKWLEQAGLPPELRDFYTLTNRPEGAAGDLYSAWLKRPLFQHISPFARIGLNRVKAGYERSPLGLLSLKNARDPQEMAEIIQKAATGTGVSEIARQATPEDFVREHPVEASLLSAGGGVYGLPLLLGMVSKSSAKSPFAEGAREVARDIPGLRTLQDMTSSPGALTRNYFSRYTNFMRPIAQAIDPEEPITDKDLFSKTLSNIPIYRGTMPHKPVKLKGMKTPAQLRFKFGEEQ